MVLLAGTESGAHPFGVTLCHPPAQLAKEMLDAGFTQLMKTIAERVAAQVEIISFSGNEDNLQATIASVGARAHGGVLASHFVVETTS